MNKMKMEANSDFLSFEITKSGRGATRLVNMNRAEMQKMGQYRLKQPKSYLSWFSRRDIDLGGNSLDSMNKLRSRNLRALLKALLVLMIVLVVILITLGEESQSKTHDSLLRNRDPIVSIKIHPIMSCQPPGPSPASKDTGGDKDPKNQSGDSKDTNPVGGGDKDDLKNTGDNLTHADPLKDADEDQGGIHDQPKRKPKNKKKEEERAKKEEEKKEKEKKEKEKKKKDDSEKCPQGGGFTQIDFPKGCSVKVSVGAQQKPESRIFSQPRKVKYVDAPIGRKSQLKRPLIINVCYRPSGKTKKRQYFENCFDAWLDKDSAEKDFITLGLGGKHIDLYMILDEDGIMTGVMTEPEFLALTKTKID